MLQLFVGNYICLELLREKFLPRELLLIEATTTHYMKRLLVLILLLKLRFDILMWLIFFQKVVRSILNIAAVFTCD